MAASRRKKPPIYYLILSLTALLLAYGLVMTASASSVTAYVEHRNSFFFLWRQVAYIAAGLVGLLVFSKIDYRWLRKASPVFLLAMIVSLVLVLVIGRTAGGASRWLDIGGFSFQPSEFVKLAVVLYAADLLSKRKKVETLGPLTKPLGLPLVVIAGLIMLQPDLGTTVIIVASVFAMLYLAGVKFRELAALALAGAATTGLLIMSAPYRRARFFAFLDPWADAKGDGFQLIQSLLALGSGGLTGVGLGLSRQKFGYLPAPFTDFILAVIGEELGLPGTLLVVVLFLLLALLILRLVSQCGDPFGRLLGAGIGTMIITQALVNMGGVTGLLPITGVPLPLISFGGNSLILTLISIGILLNISTHNRKRQGAHRESNDLRRRDGRPRLSGTRSGRGA
jgi:cell division protein FtsW